MKLIKMKNIGIALFCLTVVHCSMLQPRLDIDKAKKIKKVAVVGYEIHQAQPTDNLGLGKLKDLVKNPTEAYTQEHQAMTQKVYNSFVQQMSQKTHWKVLSANELMSNKAYAQAVSKKMSGARLISPVQENHILIDYKGLLDLMAFRKMSVEEKKQMAQNLGVDALAEVIIYVNMEQSWISLGHITGEGAFDYTARANLQLFSKDDFEDPVWRIQNVDGDKVSSDKLPKETKRIDRVTQIGFESTQSSIKKLLEHYL